MKMTVRTQKILVAIVTIVLILCIGANMALALSPSEITAGDVKTTEIENVGKKVIGVLQAIGIVASVVILTILGLKYMMGSAEEKAEYKKTLLPYFIGAFFVFGAGAICTVIFNMAGQSWT